MSLQTLTQSIDDPRDEETRGDIKTLREIGDLLEMTTRRDARVDNAPETIQKAVLTLISGNLLDSGLDAWRELLEAACKITLAVLEMIDASEDKSRAFHDILAVFQAKDINSILSVHRTTVDAMIPSLTRREMDEVLAGDYLGAMADLDAARARSPAVTLTIDDTHEKSRPKHLNGAYSYMTVGQKTKWERGLKYSCIHDATHQLFLGCQHLDRHLGDARKKELRQWIDDLRTKVHIVREAGSRVAVIEGDRGYFVAEFFASGYFGLLDLDGPPSERPRIVTPRKFTREKENYKWAYLLDPGSSQVFGDTIKLSPYTHPALKTRCEGVLPTTRDNCFEVPYACVALVDEYARGSSRTLAEARAEAKHVQARLDALGKETRLADQAYFKNYTWYAKKKPGSPGRGRERKRFHSSRDRELYDAARRLRQRLYWWKDQKNALLKALTFFAVSLRPGEDPTARPEYFVALAKDYRARWSIENGFRDVKQVFLQPRRSRKPTRRQFNLMLGMCLYNRWHVVRTHELLERYRQTAWNKVPYDPRRQWIRRKLEGEFSGITTARVYLIRLWQSGIISVLKKRFKDF